MKSKIYFEKVPIMTNNTLELTIGFVNINSFGDISLAIF